MDPDQFLNKFWKQWDDFSERKGEFFGRTRIWTDTSIDLGKSHEWHKINSLSFAPELGQVACLVCSKFLGIGTAEQNWDKVKHIKSGKRSGMQINSTEKQAIIFGQAFEGN